MHHKLRTGDVQFNKSDNNLGRPCDHNIVDQISDSHKSDTEQSALIQREQPTIGITIVSYSSSQYTLRNSRSVSDSQTPNEYFTYTGKLLKELRSIINPTHN
ncbi:hypothetical protein AVEN_220431-1 [Araneus ventricosus]|uniref:Uncharacterized protein n=1 Tax=Araneus ventricosus TaxID=182803 RepID=A0A4Y2IQC3_ARAVE|nr:hypothetical protein AVEN_220431-1 [Araneus ventricosus]